MSTFTISIQELITQNFDFGLTQDDYPLHREQLRGTVIDNVWKYHKVVAEDGTQEFFGLNAMILDHYFYWEIGQETEDMFRQMLNRRMREIMPYYNQLYASAALVFDPFQTQDTTREADSTEAVVDVAHSTNANTGTTDADSQGRSVSSTFPQMMLNQTAEDYASSAVDSNSKSHSVTDATGIGDNTRNMDNTGASTTHITGSQGHTAALLMQYRRSFLNISMMIVNELEPLFMTVIDKPDSHFGRNSNNYGQLGFGFPYFFPTI